MFGPGHSAIACSRWNIWELTFLVALKMQVNIVLMMRSKCAAKRLSCETQSAHTLAVHALYHRNKTVLTMMSALFALEVLIPVVVGALTVTKMGFAEGTCIVSSAPTLFMASWYVFHLLHRSALRSIIHRFTALVFETALFGLTLAALPGRIRSGYAGRSVVDVFVRDGTWAFALVFGEHFAVRMLHISQSVCKHSRIFAHLYSFFST